MSPHIDVARVRQKYRWNALVYDTVTRRPTARLRERAVARLALSRGGAVLDFGCGTGLSFNPLERAVGIGGRILAVDVSPDMLAIARAKVAEKGWRNVEIIEAGADDAPLTSASVDGVLCFYTHDIMRSPAALDTALRALRPGGRFVAAGVKLAHGLRGALLNPLTLAVSLAAITNVTGLERPWSLLEERLGTLDVEERMEGGAYLAIGTQRTASGPERIGRSTRRAG
jgi:demethylmenaquinone methyltransferase/2-methoxy-6-polyprenyl-1,4-benzoquinol methylase